MIRRISFVVLALAALSTAACSNPTAPTAKAPANVAANGVVPPSQVIVQGSGI